jgi:hypothetical protein
MTQSRRGTIIGAVTAVLVTATMLIGPNASAADSTLSQGVISTYGANVIVNSISGGSQAQFYHDGEHLYACDIKSDGLRSVAIASWVGVGGALRSQEVQDADGANGNCAGFANLDIVDGVNVAIMACERNGPSGTAVNCRSLPAQA